MPVKTLIVDGSAGVMLIGNYGINEAAVTQPENYLANLNFHSALEYLQIKESLTKTTAIFPAVTREYYYWEVPTSGGGGKC